MTTDNDAVEVARRHYRALEMSAAIMRDPKRTGGWEGAERTARAFERQAETAKSLYAALTTERAKVAALEAEATRWREVADELAEAAKNMLTEYQPTYHDCTDNGEPLCCLCEAEVALTRFKQESGE